MPLIDEIWPSNTDGSCFGPGQLVGLLAELS